MSTASSRVAGDQRHTRAHPCPVCRGGVDDKPGQGVRCAGYTSPDGEYCRCTREEFAGNAELDQKCQPPCFVHKLKGDCKCGRSHGIADVIPYQARAAGKAPKPKQAKRSNIHPDRIDREYTYTDGVGGELFQKVRLKGKGFLQRRADPDRPGEWLEGLDGVDNAIPYRKHDLVAASPDEPIWFFEGEKDAETGASLGLLSTTHACGDKWPEALSLHFKNRNVILCGDNDQAGRKHIADAAKSLKDHVKTLRVLDLAEQMKGLGLRTLPLKGDVTDFVEMGGTVEMLREMARLAQDPFNIQYATLADAVAVIGETTWLWERWIPNGNMTLLAAVGGGGKTRTAMDLARRLYLGLPMPDGSPNPLPAGTKTLWLMFDLNWSMSADVANSFGVPLEAIILPCLKDSPLANPDFDDPRTMESLKAQIEQEKPGLIVIDTVTYATNRNTAKAEEAKAAFDGLMNLAATTGVAVLALTHLNKEGEVLNRRITERARSVISLSRPDPEGQPDRRKLWVSKTAVREPEPLGITFTDTSNEYDSSPPEEVEDGPGKKRGPSPTKSNKDAQWLLDQLAVGPMRLSNLFDVAIRDGILKATADKPDPSKSPLYNARRRVPIIKTGYIVDELIIDSRKYWNIVAVDEVDGDHREPAEVDS